MSFSFKQTMRCQLASLMFTLAAPNFFGDISSISSNVTVDGRATPHAAIAAIMLSSRRNPSRCKWKTSSMDKSSAILDGLSSKAPS